MNQPTLSPAQLAACLDHTLPKADATAGDIENLCVEARDRRFCGVCVHGCRVELARHFLDDTGVKVVGVVGFPLGAMSGDVKRFETPVCRGSRGCSTSRRRFPRLRVHGALRILAFDF